MQLGALILGAGASTRMGTPKLLLPWHGTTVLEHTTGLWRKAGAAQVAVVTGPAPHPLFFQIPREVGHIVNAHPESGMFSSIQAAARWEGWRADLTHYAISLGDQPQIALTTLQELMKRARELPPAVWQPSVNGRPKHPVILPLSDFQTLSQTPCTTLREFLANRTVATAEINDRGLEMDLDTPDDYQRALALGSPAR